jgi:Holliday junction resolvasome RuvABC DNA-binding subunit
LWSTATTWCSASRFLPSTKIARCRGDATSSAAAAAAASAASELALRGLHNTGFSKSDVRRAEDHVSHRRVANGDEVDVQDLLRGAIAVLT